MPTSIQWHPEYPNLLLMTISGNTVLDEILDITIKEGEMIQNAGRVVDTIIDVRDTKGVPRNFLAAIPRITSMPASSHPNAGTKIVVGAIGLAETFLTIFSKVGRKLYMFKTMEEAEEFLISKG